MEVDFIKKEKRQQKLAIISIVLIVIIVIVLWQAFFKKEDFYVLEQIDLPIKEIKINFEAFEKIKRFQPFVAIEPLKEIIPEEGDDSVEVRIGRENPFLPY